MSARFQAHGPDVGLAAAAASPDSEDCSRSERKAGESENK